MLPVSLILLGATGLLSADSLSERAAKVESLSPEQKDELLRKKERFDALPSTERDRLRDLHRQLATAADGSELQGLMKRYCDWLNSLSSAQRAELLSLPADERVKKMKEILEQQERQRFQDYAGNLPEKDRETIYSFLEQFIADNEQAIIKHLPWDQKRRLQDAPDAAARRRMLIWGLQFRRPDSDMPFPSPDDFTKLLASLSAQTQKQIEQAKTADERQARARELVRAAIFSRMMPPPSEQELQKFYTGLPTQDRERLETLDSDQMRRELRQMYLADKFRNSRGPWGGWGGPGPRPGGGGPRRDGDRDDNRGDDNRRDGNRGDENRGDDNRRDGSRGNGNRGND